jgi:transposase-like protein
MYARACVPVAGRWTYLYRSADSTGATIDFLLSEKRDLTSARRFFQKALAAPGHPRPRVINVDGDPSYPTVIISATCSGWVVAIGQLQRYHAPARHRSLRTNIAPKANSSRR